MNDSRNMPSARYLEKKREEAKIALWKIVDEFKNVLKDDVHPDNRTPAYEKRIKNIFDKIVYAASDLDNADEAPGAGIFSLIVLSLRTNLYLKEEIIRLKKEMKDLQIEVKKVKATNKASSSKKKKK